MLIVGRHGKPYVERVDKNGSEHWVNDNCPKCGGTGYVHHVVDGGRCWKCGASGYHPHRWIKRTPEYQAKLDARREAKELKENAKKRKENLQNRADFLKNNGFNSEGKTYAVTGKTFDIKDALKAAGAKFCRELNWHFADRPENYPTVELTVAECFEETDLAGLRWNDAHDLQQLIKERTPREPNDSEYVGEVGERLTVALVLEKSFSFENNYSYHGGVSYIHKFVDEAGSAFVWKTKNSLSEWADDYKTMRKFKSGTIVGTVKEHSGYNGVRQTMLTRCKIKEAKFKNEED